MREHFNEKYLESEKYPTATFTGVMDDSFELNVKGNYTGSVTGKLKMHGVEKEYTVPAKLSVSQEGHFDVEVEFKVKLVDHKIEVPKLVFEKIAEEIKITFKGGYDLKVETKK
jgi:polyisoprenoid-binding protein YceI